MSSLGGKKQPPDRAHLEQLRTEELKEIIRADAESTSGGDEDFIFTVLEVIAEREKRQPDYQPPDLNAAWQRFQQYYNTPDGVGQSLFPVEGSEEKRSRPAEKMRRMGRPGWKRLAIIAAAIAILLAGIFTAQAAGIDIPGIIARWTDDVFYFEGSATETSGQAEWAEVLIKQALEKGQLTTWVPDGFYAGEILKEDLNSVLLLQQDYADQKGQTFSIEVIIYSSPDLVPNNAHEKDSETVVEYPCGRHIVYMFSNYGRNTATCLDGCIEITITGDLSFEDLLQVFNSLEGV